MEVRSKNHKQANRSRIHVFLDEALVKDLDWLAAIYDGGNRSGTVRQLISDQMEREMRSPSRARTKRKPRLMERDL